MDLAKQERLWKAKQARLAATQAAAPRQITPPKTGGIDPRAWISEIGGTVGGIGAGALSLGNPLAIAAGAAAGSAIGKSLEQAVKGEAINQKDVLTEAGLSALFAGGPIRLSKGLLGAVRGGAKEATKQVAKKGAFTGLQRQGIKQIGEAWGIDPGAKLVASGKVIGVSKANALQNFARKIGVKKTSSAIDVQDITETFAKQTSQTIKNKLAKVKQPFDVKKVLSELDDAYKNEVFGPKSKELVKDLKKAVLRTNGNHDKLWGVRIKVDKNINNFNKGSDLASTSAQQIGSETRKVINNVLKQVDGIADDFAKYNQASDILTLVGPAVKGPKGSVVPGTGLRVLGGTTQRVRAVAGNLLKGRAGVAGGAGKPPTLLGTVAGQAVRQITPITLRAAVTPPGVTPPELPEEAQMGVEGMGLEAPEAVATDPRLNAIRAAIVQDIQKTGGKNLKNIQTVANAYGIDLTPLGLGTGAKTGFAALTADQQKRVANLNTVSAALNALEQGVTQSGLFPNEPQLVSSLLGRARGTIGAATTPEQRQYISSLRSRGIQIIRALGEVGNLSATEQDAAFQLLPQPGDNAQTAAGKIQQLRDLFNQVAQRVVNPNIGTFQ